LQSELSDSFMVNITVAYPGHKVLQLGHVPQMAPLGAATDI